MKVLITGATGLIGKEIVTLLNDNDISVHYLTTRKDKIESGHNYQGFFWNPKIGEIDTECIKDVDAIINLVGATVAKRWTESYKKEIIDSRVQSANLLLKTLKEQNHNVKQIISASAIGIYPHHMTNYYEEDHNEVDDSFLGRVVEQWEHSVEAFKSIGVKVSIIRIGLVLSSKGGALPQIAKPIRMGLGAAFGSGKQWQSWIHITDLTRMFKYILDHELEGIYNGVSPNPIKNRELTRTTAEVLRRPLILPNIPRFFMKLILGDMYIVLFSSHRVSSKKIEDKGFNIKFHHLKPALVDLLK
ncbi:MAG: TIGR01777 family protein [Flavobacteriaceae bacterium]|nr:TIGR01777 family oxidoreductase [Bacteroidia bacterium]NNL60481.1 TIGR01777 family protein [Flavobacteriaceae bacterium]